MSEDHVLGGFDGHVEVETAGVEEVLLREVGESDPMRGSGSGSIRFGR